jgi:hypothetical protein
MTPGAVRIACEWTFLAGLSLALLALADRLHRGAL